MNEFVNPHKRSVELPAGCRDLIDVLSQCGREASSLVESLADIERYLSRMSQSVAKSKQLSIVSMGHYEHIAVFHGTGKFSLMVFVDTKHPDQQQAVLSFFNGMKVTPLGDSGGHSLGVSLRIFVYPLPVNVAQAASLIREFLERVCGLEESASLRFSYHESLRP